MTAGRHPATQRRKRVAQGTYSCRLIVATLEPTMAQEKPDAVLVMLPASTLRRVSELALKGM